VIMNVANQQDVAYYAVNTDDIQKPSSLRATKEFATKLHGLIVGAWNAECKQHPRVAVSNGECEFPSLARGQVSTIAQSRCYLLQRNGQWMQWVD
jgi:hypothetical protein